MKSIGHFDVAVVGGGVMGCATALPLARAGMKVAVFDRRGLGLEASGRNAGSLSPMIKRAEVVAHAMRGYHMWMSSREWLDRSLQPVRLVQRCLAVQGCCPDHRVRWLASSD